MARFERTESGRPDILYIMSDQHSRRVAGCYGDDAAITPNLDALAARGVSFDAAYCPSPICVPSRMSAFTGQWPFEQECWTLQDHLSSDRPTWMHSLGAAGYRPVLAGRMHSVGPDQHHGFAERLGGDAGPHWPGVPRQDLGMLAGAQGPERGSLERSGPGQSGYQLVDEEAADAACAYLRRVAEARQRGDDTPLCLMLGLLLPHCPFVARSGDYARFEGSIDGPRLPPPDGEHPWLRSWRTACGIDAPDEAAVIRARTAYYALVMRMDMLIGRVLDALHQSGLGKNTLVVYCSDHGEQAGERGHWWKNTFYEESAGVPLVLSWPGQLPEGARRGHVANLVDVGATLIEAAGAPALPSSHGRSLLGIAADARAPWTDTTFSEYVTDNVAGFTGPKPTRQRMIRAGRYKLVVIDGYRPILHDLETDPDEMHDLACDPAHAPVRDALARAALSDWEPARIARTVARREAEKRILHAWAGAIRPPLHHVRPLAAAESWLDPQPVPERENDP